MADVTRRRYPISSALTLAWSGCASDEVDEPTETAAPSDIVNGWLDEHQEKQRSAVEPWSIDRCSRRRRITVVGKYREGVYRYRSGAQAIMPK